MQGKLATTFWSVTTTVKIKFLSHSADIG